MCADPDWLQRDEDELMATISLAIPEQLRGKIDMDDVRQGAFVRYHRNPTVQEGRSAGERLAYFKMALASELSDVIARFQARSRDTARERPLDTTFDDSSDGRGQWLAADQTSPSGRASRQEQLTRLAAALAELPPDQRQAVQLHHLEGHTLANTASAMGISKPSVAGLIFRGMQRLRELLKD
jgi:RNA polymerase sigma-70 factor, ECF subfamily